MVDSWARSYKTVLMSFGRLLCTSGGWGGAICYFSPVWSHLSRFFECFPSGYEGTFFPKQGAAKTFLSSLLSHELANCADLTTLQRFRPLHLSFVSRLLERVPKRHNAEGWRGGCRPTHGSNLGLSENEPREDRECRDHSASTGSFLWTVLVFKSSIPFGVACVPGWYWIAQAKETGLSKKSCLSENTIVFWLPWQTDRFFFPVYILQNPFLVSKASKKRALLRVLWGEGTG